jgi:hypothetical protein
MARSFRTITSAAAVLLAGCSHCDNAEEVLATSGDGARILSTFEACTSLGTTVESSIVLEGADRRRSVLMKYEPNGGILRTTNGVSVPATSTPAATWLSDGSLEIHIDVVATVMEQAASVNGKQIHYRIDNDISLIEALPPNTSLERTRGR